jgi:putative mycofactocin binding protein MftB
VASTDPGRTTPVFELDRPWALHPQVAVRPERFGALAYHFGTRRLSFLKSRRLVELVSSLDEHPTARAAIESACVPVSEVPAYLAALGTLASTGMIEIREAQT